MSPIQVNDANDLKPVCVTKEGNPLRNGKILWGVAPEELLGQKLRRQQLAKAIGEVTNVASVSFTQAVNETKRTNHRLVLVQSEGRTNVNLNSLEKAIADEGILVGTLPNVEPAEADMETLFGTYVKRSKGKKLPPAACTAAVSSDNSSRSNGTKPSKGKRKAAVDDGSDSSSGCGTKQRKLGKSGSQLIFRKTKKKKARVIVDSSSSDDAGSGNDNEPMELDAEADSVLCEVGLAWIPHCSNRDCKLNFVHPSVYYCAPLSCREMVLLQVRQQHY
jgi:hypothetical protein